MQTVRMLGWFPALGALFCAVLCPAQQIQNGSVTVRAVESRHRFTGFDVQHGSQTVAVVRLSSQHLLTAGSCAVTANGTTLVFSRLEPAPGCGLRLGPGDAFRVKLNPGDHYPVLAFDLNVVGFDSKAWEGRAGKEPFHFLALYLPDAEVWHQGGWLNATPRADPFPLLLDRHAGTPEISAYHYNRSWSYTPPLGANPLPIIGLWAPQHRHYAGIEFQTTRLEDNSERDIATGYHWLGQTNPPYAETPSDASEAWGEFVALVYPYGGRGYQQLVFPKPGAHLASRGVLLWSTRLGPSDDPNRFFFAYLWRRAKDRLPGVPAAVDLSWLPGGDRLRDFEGPPGDRLIGGVEARFQVPGSKVLGGWRWEYEMPTQIAKARGETLPARSLEDQAAELVRYAKHFRVGGEDSVYWEKPLTGAWTAAWGGPPVTTLHNANGFAAGRLFLSLYRDFGKQEYLPIIDGVFHWAEQVVWTRNEFADVPSSPFAIGGTLPTSFCLDYYFTFKNAPDAAHRAAARRALDLARSFTYRYLVMWPSDNNRFDNLDSAFLWEPNSGRDWTGAACANEVFWDLDTLAQTAVHTGDPVLMWALQGSLDRWHILYQNRYKGALRHYSAGDMAEGYGLYPGNIYGVGRRAAYGFSSPLAMIEPVGNSIVRVLAGEKAAMAFDKHNLRTMIADYHYTGPGDLSFTVRSPSDDFSLSLTVPYVDLSRKPVALIRAGQTIALPPGRDFRRPPQAIWSLYLRNLRNGDTVVVGEPNPGSPPLPCTAPLAEEPYRARLSKPLSLFDPVLLPCHASPDTDWNHLDSWAGLWRGSLWAYGIHFILAPATAPSAVDQPVRFDPPFGPARTAAVLYSDGDGPRPSLLCADGSRVPLEAASEAVAWRAWPPIYTAKLLVATVNTAGRPIAGLDPAHRLVWAVSVAREGLVVADDYTAQAIQQALQTRQALQAGAQAWQREKRDDRATAELKAKAASLPAGSVAVLPPTPAGPVINLATRAGFDHCFLRLTPEQLIDPDIFNAKRFPVALYSGGEDYLDTVRSPGDAADAVVRYVEQGGTLLLLSPLPWPMYYATGPGFHRSHPLTARLGLPLGVGFESLPTNQLTVVAPTNQSILRGVPTRLPFPTADARLRTVQPDGIPPGANYTPIYRVTGNGARHYGDAAGLVEFSHGGRILYVWGGLLRDPDYGPAITRAALEFLIRSCAGDSSRGR